MQTNELVGQVHKGPRLPHADRAPTAKRAKPATPVKRLSSEESQRPSTRQLERKPRGYGAGI